MKNSNCQNEECIKLRKKQKRSTNGYFDLRNCKTEGCNWMMEDKQYEYCSDCRKENEMYKLEYTSIKTQKTEVINFNNLLDVKELITILKNKTEITKWKLYKKNKESINWDLLERG